MTTGSYLSGEVARLATLGGLDGDVSGGTTPVFDASVVRSGERSLRCDGTAANASHASLYGGAFSFNATTNTKVHNLQWFRVTALPTATKIIMHLTYDATLTSIKLTSGGGIEFWAGAASANDRLLGSLAGVVAAGEWFGILIERVAVHNTNAVNEMRAWFFTDNPERDALIGESATCTPAELRMSQSLPGAHVAGWVNAPGLTASLYLDDGICRYAAGWTRKPSPRQKITRLPAARVVANTSSQWHTCRSTTYTESHSLEAVNGLVTAAHADSTSDGTAHQLRNTSAASAGTPSVIEFECQSYGRAGIPGHVIVGSGGAGRQSVGDASARTRIAQGLYVGPGIGTIALSLMKVGSPTDDLVVEVQSDSAGAPSGTVIASFTLAGTGLTTSVAEYIDYVQAPTGVGVKAWLVLSRSGSVDASNYYQVQTTSATNTYRDGGTAAHNGTSWGAVDSTATWVMRIFNDIGQARIDNLAIHCYHGEAVSTGTKTGVVKLTNPDQGAVTAFNYGNDGGAAGAFPTLWTAFPALVGAFQANPGTPSIHAAARFSVDKRDTGTRAVLCSAVVVICEWSEPLPGWNEVIKTSDSTHWWAKYAPTRLQVVTYPSGVETDNVVEGGEWFLVADPLPDDGVLASITVVTDTTLRASYTPA
jgi:hypothetical protein